MAPAKTAKVLSHWSKPPPLMSLGSTSSGQLVVDGENRTKLIVNYLPQTMQDIELWDIFSRYGEVVSVKIIRDLATQYSYGYGFVEYTRPEDAASAILNLKGYPVKNKRLGVAYARVHSKEDLRDTNLYIANIPISHLNDYTLRELFSRFGKIINLKVLHNERSRQDKGTAFVRFDRKQEAEEAIRQLNGYVFPGTTDPLVVKVSEEHGKQMAIKRAFKGPPARGYPGPPPPSYGFEEQQQRGNFGSDYRVPQHGYEKQDWGGGKSTSSLGGGYRGHDQGGRGRRNYGGHELYDRKGGRFGGGGSGARGGGYY